MGESCSMEHFLETSRGEESNKLIATLVCEYREWPCIHSVHIQYLHAPTYRSCLYRLYGLHIVGCQF